MKTLGITVSMALGAVLAVPVPAGAAADTSVGQGFGAQQTKVTPEMQMPIYRPPSRPSRGGRVDGNSRGDEGEWPAVFVFSPKNHVGLTTRAQPSLFWYLSKPTTYPIEFVFDVALDESLAKYERSRSKPLLEKRIKNPGQAGVQRIDLKEYGVTLEPNVKYKWFIRVVINPEGPTPDIVASGFIERVDFVEALSIHFSSPGNGDAVLRLAEAGIWYDAIAMVCEAIERNLDNNTLRKQRASLLRQVDLQEVARHDSPE